MTHGDDLPPGDTGHAVTPGIGNVSGGFANLLDRMPDGAKEHGVRVEIIAGSAAHESRGVASSKKHVLDAHTIVERTSVPFTRHGEGVPL